jgi:hypothetical protein
METAIDFLDIKSYNRRATDSVVPRRQFSGSETACGGYFNLMKHFEKFLTNLSETY